MGLLKFSPPIERKLGANKDSYRMGCSEFIWLISFILCFVTFVATAIILINNTDLIHLDEDDGGEKTNPTTSAPHSFDKILVVEKLNNTDSFMSMNLNRDLQSGNETTSTVNDEKKAKAKYPRHVPNELAFLLDSTSNTTSASSSEPFNDMSSANSSSEMSHGERKKLEHEKPVVTVKFASRPIKKKQNRNKNRTKKLKAPRGFCTHISRVLSPNARCYAHLTATPVPKKHPHSRVTRAAPNSASSIVKEAIPSHHEGEQQPGGLATVQDEEQQEQDEEEELVYVRLETLGSNITDLNTLAINDRLLASLFSQLLEEGAGESGSTKRQATSITSGAERDLYDHESRLIDESRMQIWSVSSQYNSNNKKNNDVGDVASGGVKDQNADYLNTREPPGPEKCHLAIEKFLCRLVYPTCHFRKRDIGALVRPPCREDCLLLRDSLCPNLDWAHFGQALRAAIARGLANLPISEFDYEFGHNKLVAPTASPRIPGPQTITKQQSHSQATPANKDQNNNNLGPQGETNNYAHNEKEPSTTGTHSNNSNKLIQFDNNNNNELHMRRLVHLYWPHEKSIQNCELLPIYRQLDQLTISSFGPPETEIITNQQQVVQLAADGTKQVEKPVRETIKSILPVNETTSQPRSSKVVDNRNFNGAHLQSHVGGLSVHQSPRRHGSSRWPSCSYARLDSIGWLDAGSHLVMGRPGEQPVTHNSPKRETRSLTGAPTIGLQRRECLETSEGSNYRGRLNKTRGQIGCQSWASQEPHKHSR